MTWHDKYIKMPMLFKNTLGFKFSANKSCDHSLLFIIITVLFRKAVKSWRLAKKLPFLSKGKGVK
jgi:hypothetical protein